MKGNSGRRVKAEQSRTTAEGKDGSRDEKGMALSERGLKRQEEEVG